MHFFTLVKYVDSSKKYIFLSHSVSFYKDNVRSVSTALKRSCFNNCKKLKLHMWLCLSLMFLNPNILKNNGLNPGAKNYSDPSGSATLLIRDMYI